jgi:hypothetical protein
VPNVKFFRAYGKLNKGQREELRQIELPEGGKISGTRMLRYSKQTLVPMYQCQECNKWSEIEIGVFLACWFIHACMYYTLFLSFFLYFYVSITVFIFAAARLVV